MNITKTKSKKRLSIILIAVLALMGLLVAGMMHLSTTTLVYASQLSNEEMIVEQRFENQTRSIEMAEIFMQAIRTESADNNGVRRFVYDDNFAGVFLDENGTLTIATVSAGFDAMSFTTSRLDGQVIHQQFTYSYNHLLSIKEIIVPVMQSNVFTVSIDEMNNNVRVYVENYATVGRITNELQQANLFSATAVTFIVDPNQRNEITNNFLAYGGDGINGGTLGVNAIHNATGQLGLLTNYHVVRVGNMARTGGRDVGLATVGELRDNGRVDASFAPFADQDAWLTTPNARRGGRYYRNIRLGNESQIVVNAQIRRLGTRTGDTTTRITTRDHTVNLDWDGGTVRVRNSFSFDISQDIRGDSGGPIYFIGASGNHYLIGLTFAQNNAQTQGRGTRMSSIMADLGITPITNDIFNPTNAGNGIQVNNVATSIPAATRRISVPANINGRTVTHIGQSAFANHQHLRTVDLPEGLTNIGASAFQNANSVIDITLPPAVTTIGINAFPVGVDITWLNGSHFRTSVENIGLEIINRTVNRFVIPPHSIHRPNFAGTISIPEGVTSIALGVFNGNQAIYHVHIASTVTTIGNSAFANTTNLLTVELAPNSRLSIINDNAFRSSSLMTNIAPASLTHIGASAFENTRIRYIIIPPAVRHIGTHAFRNIEGIGHPPWDSRVFFGGTPSDWQRVRRGINALPHGFSIYFYSHNLPSCFWYSYWHFDGWISPQPWDLGDKVQIPLWCGTDIPFVRRIFVREGGSFGRLPQPIKRDHIFLGWYCFDMGRVTSESVVSNRAATFGLFAEWKFVLPCCLGDTHILPERHAGLIVNSAWWGGEDEYVTHLWPNWRWWGGLGGGVVNESFGVEPESMAAEHSFGAGSDIMIVGFELYTIWDGRETYELRFVPDLTSITNVCYWYRRIDGKLLVWGEFFSVARLYFCMGFSGSETNLVTPIWPFPHRNRDHFDNTRPPTMHFRIVVRTLRIGHDCCYVFESLPVFVDFDLQGGYGVAEMIMPTLGQAFGELPSAVSKADHVFMGWFTKPYGQGQQIFCCTIVLFMGAKTLYAYWW